MILLVINAGSSSLKYKLYQMPQSRILSAGRIEGIGREISNFIQTKDNSTSTQDIKLKNHVDAIALILNVLVDKQNGIIKSLDEISAVSHRVVHGGNSNKEILIVDDKVIAFIGKFAKLAPLHNSADLAGIKAIKRKLPSVTQVVCFDTGFHRTIPQVAYTYALPHKICEKYGIRRYGFHGISHQYVARRASTFLGKPIGDLNIITCHLGNGCSVTAIKNGESIDTSMGFTPLEGLVMGTRPGDFDPAIIFFLKSKGFSIKRIQSICNRESGLLGISGLSNDMREILKSAQKGNRLALLALNIFSYRVKKYVGAYFAVLGRVDVLVFTAGIGENIPQIRENICADLQDFGIEIDNSKNFKALAVEADISVKGSKVKTLVIPTDEELAIAQKTLELLTKT